MSVTRLSAVVVAALPLALVLGGCSGDDSPEDTSSAQPSGTTAPARSEGDEQLDILLTNDDGWDAPGIRAVYAALQAEGHRVTVVAPAGNQSGVGGLKTFFGPITASQPDLAPFPEYAGGTVWAVGPTDANPKAGTPSDSVLFGLGHVLASDPPDLVVSGANRGINTGGAVNNSGTVNAAIEALEQHVPAVAISTENPAECDPASGREIDFAGSAAYTVDLVAALVGNRDGDDPLLPTGVGLNVTYPAAEVQGTKLTRSDVDPARLDYVESAPGQFDIVPACNGSEDDENTDYGAMLAGYVAITPLAAAEVTGTVSDDLDFLADLG